MDHLHDYDSSSSCGCDDGDQSQHHPPDHVGDDICQKKRQRPAKDCTPTSTASDTDTDTDTDTDHDVHKHDPHHFHKKRPRQRGSVTIVSDREAQSQSLFVRAQPHVRGNWAGHVFVRIPISSSSTTSTTGTAAPSDSSDSSSVSADESEADSSWQSAVNESVAMFRDDLERAGYTGTLVPHEHCHLSLSRPFYLQVASIDSFIQKLTERLQLCPVTTVRILASNNYKYKDGDDDDDDKSSKSNKQKQQSNILVNDDQTRSFWTWPVLHQQQSNAALLQIVQAVNAVLKIYNQPVYYDPPHFHVSLASFVSSASASTQSSTTNTSATAATDMHQDLPKRMQQLATRTSRSNDDDNVDDKETVANTTTTASSTSIFCFPCTIPEIQCTFGTTKSYTIPLLQS
jgi:hypothetical protein